MKQKRSCQGTKNNGGRLAAEVIPAIRITYYSHPLEICIDSCCLGRSFGPCLPVPLLFTQASATARNGPTAVAE